MRLTRHNGRAGKNGVYNPKHNDRCFDVANSDHTDAAMLERSGAKRRKPRLTQHLGIPPEEMVIEPARRRGRIYPGDVFLLCSDGLTDMVPTDEIRQILSVSNSAVICADALVTSALAAGGRDNVTVIVCRVLPRV